MIDFLLTSEQLEVKEAARAFAEKELLPGVVERDRTMTFPVEQVQLMGELGFMGMMTSPEYGGGGMDTVSYILALEELAKIDAVAAVIMSVNNSLVCWGLEAFGTEWQKESYLKPLANGAKLGAFCLSEPQIGSDATSQHTTAVRQGDHYLLNGTKNWITNGSHSDIHLVMAQSDSTKGSGGINAFIVDAHWPGIHIGPKEDKMGIRASDTVSISYQDVLVPAENRIGDEGSGFSFAMQTLAGGRIGIAAQAVGIARGAYELSVRYAKQRESFGKPIIQHQAIAFKLAEMATELEAAHLLVMRAARLKDERRDFVMAGSMAKLFAADMAMRQTSEAVQIHGGYGYVREYQVERMMRDAKITQIYEGTSEIQKLVISRKILQGALYAPFLD